MKHPDAGARGALQSMVGHMGGGEKFVISEQKKITPSSGSTHAISAVSKRQTVVVGTTGLPVGAYAARPMSRNTTSAVIEVQKKGYHGDAAGVVFASEATSGFFG
jgi:hypothetical protein